MNGKRISELPEKVLADASDIVPVVDVGVPGGYVSKRTTVSGLVQQFLSSWWSSNTDKIKLDNINLASGKTITVNNTTSLSSADGASVNLGAGGTVLYSNSVLDGGQY